MAPRAAIVGVSALVGAACGGGGAGPGPLDAGPDAPPAPRWATYRIEIGSHSATVLDATSANPVRGPTTVGGRRYQFAFDPTAAYQLTDPVEPADQFDWNKLPGLSDCGDIDLSVNGAMFGWRWRLDLAPPVLELTAYANNAGVHLTPPAPLFTLTAAELALATPLTYRLDADTASYRFAVSGAVGDRSIDAGATLPRVCPDAPADTLRWASGLYFGGTSTAPSVITGTILEAAAR